MRLPAFTDEPPVRLTRRGEALLVAVVALFCLAVVVIGPSVGAARQCAALTAQHSPRAAAVCPPAKQR